MTTKQINIVDVIMSEIKILPNKWIATFEWIEKILEKYISTQSNVVENKERYYLVNNNWDWIFSSYTREIVEDFKNNMLKSWRFAVWKVKAMVIIDIQSLWKISK
jgi:aromatic ring hydroxylase